MYACSLVAGGHDEEQCTSGFLDSNSIDDNSMSEIVALPDSSLSGLLSDFTRWIFPSINFTCNGYITSWTLRVKNSTEAKSATLIPQITTWRLQESGIGYMQQSITNESQGMLKMDTESTFIEYTPLQPISVQTGDIVGIMLPSMDDGISRIKPLFLKLPEGNSSTISCIRLEDSQFFFFQSQSCINNGVEEEQSLYIPLISVVISKLPHCV